MVRWLFALAIAGQMPLAAGTAAEVARAIRENAFDRDECYRVRDISVVREDIRIFFGEGHLIFSKPVAGRRIAAVFTADVEGGDGEIILLPPDRAERRSLARYIESPNLDEHFRTALLLFTGDEYDRIKSQFPANSANRRTPEIGAILDEDWTPVLRNLGASYQTRLTLDLLNGRGGPSGLFAAMIRSPKLGNFDVVYDPEGNEQILAGHVANRNNRLYFDVWTSFSARSFRNNPAPRRPTVTMRDYRIEATVNPDLSLDAVTRVKVKATEDANATAFDVSPEMEVTGVTVDGRAAEVLLRESLRLNLTHGGNNVFVVVPPEPLHAGKEYEFEFRHSGKVIHDAGDRVFYVSARGSWYPTHGLTFTQYDLLFRYPKDLELVTPGDVVEDRTDGDWRITRRRTAAAIRIAAFNLGNYRHARLERGGYIVDVCANRALERALRPSPESTVIPNVPPVFRPRHPPDPIGETQITPAPPDPLARLKDVASEVTSAMEFMASKFGPPALPHLTVSPIPGAFGQGFPGLIYLSTLAYIGSLPGPRTPGSQQRELFFRDVLEPHETAHQWWGNRVCVGSYRDYWLMEALANYSALLYLEKTKGAHVMDQILDGYRTDLLAKGDNGQTVDATGPIVLGTRLESSQEPRAWNTITYGKGSWIIQMIRRRMGDERFLSMLVEMLKRYDHKEVSTEGFRQLAAGFLPPKSDDPHLETFFEQWVYGTGIPNLKLAWSLKGKAPALRLVGTLTQSDVGDDFTALVPVEIQAVRGRAITQWVRSANTPVTFSMPLAQPPLKVTLDPHRAVLRY